MLPIVECFHSIQGEGFHVGKSAFFIRLAKCNVGCSWCDTKQSWNSNIHPLISTQELSHNAAQAKLDGANFIVITGGEPLHHNLTPLCTAIRKSTLNKENKPIPIHLETSGVDSLTGCPDWITLSPKPHAPPKVELLMACHELKVVINSKEDLIFAEQMATKLKTNSSKKTLLFLQPGWENQAGQALAFEYVKHHPEWRLSMQTHKWLGIL